MYQGTSHFLSKYRETEKKFQNRSRIRRVAFGCVCIEYLFGDLLSMMKFNQIRVYAASADFKSTADVVLSSTAYGTGEIFKPG